MLIPNKASYLTKFIIILNSYCADAAVILFTREMKEEYKPEKKVADLHWPKTDSILTATACLYKLVQHLRNATFSYV